LDSTQDTCWTLQTAPENGGYLGTQEREPMLGDATEGRLCWHRPCESGLLEEAKLCCYYRKLQMIYGGEQQIIDLLAELISEATQPQLRERISEYRSAGPCHRYLIKDLAGPKGLCSIDSEHLEDEADDDDGADDVEDSAHKWMLCSVSGGFT
jgi:hypothetical protein